MWAFGKRVLNSTLGTDKFKSLDKILTDKRMSPSDDVFLHIVQGTKTFETESVYALTTFKTKYRGSFNIKGEMYTSVDTYSTINLLINGVVKGTHTLSKVSTWEAFTFNATVEADDLISLQYAKIGAQIDSVRNIALCAVLVDDIGANDNQDAIRYSHPSDNTSIYWCMGINNKDSIRELYVLDDISGVPVTTVSGFTDATNLKDVRFGSNTQVISIGAFSGTALEKVVIPASVTNVANSAFGYCSKLKTVIFKGTPSGLLSNGAFEECPNLTDIYVPWSEGAVSNAPWGAEYATIHYNSEV